MDVDAGPLAEVLVVGALVGVLEPAPAADVVDEDRREVGAAGLHVVDQPSQRLAAVDVEAALALVGVGPDDLEAAALRRTRGSRLPGSRSSTAGARSTCGRTAQLCAVLGVQVVLSWGCSSK